MLYQLRKSEAGKGVGRIPNLPTGFRRPFGWNKKTKYPEQGPIHQPPTGSWDSMLLLSAEILYENKSSKQQLSKNKTKKVKRNRKKMVDYYAPLFANLLLGVHDINISIWMYSRKISLHEFFTSFKKILFDVLELFKRFFLPKMSTLKWIQSLYFTTSIYLKRDKEILVPHSLKLQCCDP